MYSRIFQSPLGSLEIICDKHHVLSISFVSNGRPKFQSSNELCLEVEESLKKYFKGTLTEFSLPIQFKGTPFQNKVWKTLCEIPYGETWTYKDLAERIGQPKAYRAVGGANNKNPLGIIVPCHRVIGSKGELTGYAAGVGCKEKLLSLEKRAICRHHPDRDLHR